MSDDDYFKLHKAAEIVRPGISHGEAMLIVADAIASASRAANGKCDVWCWKQGVPLLPYLFDTIKEVARNGASVTCAAH